MAPASSALATPCPRCSGGTTKHTTDQTGCASTGFITGERSSFANAVLGPSDTQPTGASPR